jgi:hypothetical protein
MEAPGLCSPSRKVVSKMIKCSLDMFISWENEVSVNAKAGYVGLKRNGDSKKQKMGNTAPHGAGTMNNRIVGEVF